MILRIPSVATTDDACIEARYEEALEDMLHTHHWTEKQGLSWSMVMLPQLSMTLNAMQRMEQTHKIVSKSEIADFEHALHVSKESDREILRGLMEVPELGEHRFFDLMTDNEHDALVFLPFRLIFKLKLLRRVQAATCFAVCCLFLLCGWFPTVLIFWGGTHCIYHIGWADFLMWLRARISEHELPETRHDHDCPTSISAVICGMRRRVLNLLGASYTCSCNTIRVDKNQCSFYYQLRRVDGASEELYDWTLVHQEVTDQQMKMKAALLWTMFSANTMLAGAILQICGARVIGMAIMAAVSGHMLLGAACHLFDNIVWDFSFMARPMPTRKSDIDFTGFSAADLGLITPRTKVTPKLLGEIGDAALRDSLESQLLQHSCM